MILSVIFEHRASPGVFQLAESLELNLPDALSCHLQDRLEGVRVRLAATACPKVLQPKAADVGCLSDTRSNDARVP